MIYWIAPIAGFTLFALNEIVNPRWTLLGKVHWQGDPKGVALTFDDGPHPLYTPRVLEILDRFRVKATFFIVGRFLEKHGDLVAVASRAGHLMANHSYHHFRTMSFSSPKRIRREILQCQEELERRIGYRPRFYRQPAGFRNPRIFGILNEIGMSLVGWQVRAFDTQIRESKSIAEKVLGKIQPGGIILLHDGSDSESGGDRTPTLGALPMIIQGLKDRGMEFFTLDRLLGMSREEGRKT